MDEMGEEVVENWPARLMSPNSCQVAVKPEL